MGDMVEPSTSREPVTPVLDNVLDGHRVLPIAHEDDMINIVNEHQTQQVAYLIL
jgi:hypothetical protein